MWQLVQDKEIAAGDLTAVASNWGSGDCQPALAVVQTSRFPNKHGLRGEERGLSKRRPETKRRWGGHLYTGTAGAVNSNRWLPTKGIANSTRLLRCEVDERRKLAVGRGTATEAFADERAKCWKRAGDSTNSEIPVRACHWIFSEGAMSIIPIQKVEASLFVLDSCRTYFPPGSSKPS